MTAAVCSLALWAIVQGAAIEYDLPPEPIYHLLIAESNGNHDAIGDEGRALGVAQFHQGTFEWLVERYGLEYEWPEDALKYESSVEILCAAIDEGRAGLWHGWRGVDIDVIGELPGRAWGERDSTTVQ